MYRVTYKVNGKDGVEFYHESEMLTETFEAVKAVIRANPITFPNPERIFDSYFNLLAHMNEDGMTMHENHVFRVEYIGNAE